MRISDWSSDVCSSDLTSCTDGRAERRARTELGGAGDKSRCDAGTKDTEPEDGQAGERQAHRLADVGLLALQRRGKLGEEVRYEADDDAEHHDLVAGRHDIAEHAFSEEAGAVPDRKRDQEEAGQGVK